jgi:tripartite-type tricarboxylate transporter receptor subunit TctC
VTASIPSISRALVALGLALAAALAQGQTYPVKPIRLVVPYGAGGPADLLARGLGKQLAEVWGQQILVENKPGAGQIIAAQEVAKSAPDGYTYLVASDAVFTLNGYLYSKLPYDAARDFAPLSRLINANLVLVARPDFPASSVREFVEYAKKNPGKLNYGSVGVGTGNHIAMSWFNSQYGIDVQHVPYKKLMQGVQDIMTGRLDVMLVAIGAAAPQINAGKVKGLAVSGKERNALIPSVPTFAEAGFAGFDASFWIGIAAPAGTPEELLAKFAAESAKIVKTTGFRKRYLDRFGFEPVGDTPDQFAAFLREDRVSAARRVKASGAKLD